MSEGVATSSASEVPADAGKTSSGSKTDDTKQKSKWFSLAGHLHLGLGLRLGQVYSEKDLRSRCRGHQEKLSKLEQCLADSTILKEVSAPAAKARRDDVATEKKQVHSATRAGSQKESRAARKRYRDSSKRLSVGQLVWHSAIQPRRPARVTAIAPEREDMYLIRYIGSGSAERHTGRFKHGDVVTVRGRKGGVIWDGRPEHQFAKLRWESGTESDVMPVSEIRAQDVDDDLFVHPEDLEPMSVSQYMEEMPTGSNPSAGSARPAAIRPSGTDQSLLCEGSVAWVIGESRAPWPVQLQSLISSESEPRVWRVRHLGTGDADNEEVPACRLSPFMSGDARALAAVAEEVELAHAKRAAEQAASRTAESQGEVVVAGFKKKRQG